MSSAARFRSSPQGIVRLAAYLQRPSESISYSSYANNYTGFPYMGHRFPHEIISSAIWLYYRFSLSSRDVEELLAERGIMVTYETVRQW